MIDPAIDAEYNIRQRHPESPQHYARYAADSVAARAALVDGQLDLAYGPAAGERLDFFRAAGREPPLLLFIHGGYWRALDKADFSFVAPPFVAAGIAVALINYDLTPRVTVETIVAQTQRAICWTYDNRALDFDRQRLVVAGHSAGGHLTAMALAAEPRLPIAAGIAISGVFDLVPLLKTNVNEQLTLDEARARALSPLHRPRPARPPALIGVGGAETDGFIGQSRDYARRIGKAATIYPGLDHYTIMSALADPASDIHRDVSAVIAGTGPAAR
ncbi:MAG: alpha/beta hydrolase [Alphaproteobacteria bacterium]|nr:alpha/beta hydrolase [Alphaproteobacteria bacterium]